MIEHRYDDINQESSYYDYVVGKKSGKTIKLTATGLYGKEKGKLVKQGSGYRYTLLSKKSGSKGTVTVKKRGKITKKYLKYFYGTWKTEFGDRIKITKKKLDGKNYRIIECKKKNGKYYLYTIVKNKSGGKYYFEKGMYELSSGKKNSMIGYWYNSAWGGYTGGYSLRK
jgi:hypothetical protein